MGQGILYLYLHIWGWAPWGRGPSAVAQLEPPRAGPAHISGMGLKVVPMIAPFSTLRAVNLSSNFIGEQSTNYLLSKIYYLVARISPSA